MWVTHTQTNRQTDKQTKNMTAWFFRKGCKVPEFLSFSLFPSPLPHHPMLYPPLPPPPLHNTVCSVPLETHCFWSIRWSASFRVTHLVGLPNVSVMEMVHPWPIGWTLSFTCLWDIWNLTNLIRGAGFLISLKFNYPHMHRNCLLYGTNRQAGGEVGVDRSLLLLPLLFSFFSFYHLNPISCFSSLCITQTNSMPTVPLWRKYSHMLFTAILIKMVLT